MPPNPPSLLEPLWDHTNFHSENPKLPSDLLEAMTEDTRTNSQKRKVRRIMGQNQELFNRVALSNWERKRLYKLNVIQLNATIAWMKMRQAQREKEQEEVLEDQRQREYEQEIERGFAELEMLELGDGVGQYGEGHADQDGDVLMEEDEEL